MFLTDPHPGGAVAQLEEYLNGIQGVVGSNPISSTKTLNKIPFLHFPLSLLCVSFCVSLF